MRLEIEISFKKKKFWLIYFLLKKMRKEYDAYIKTLLYFLDPEKIAYVKEWEEQYKNKTKRPPCFKPGAKSYFNSDKVLDTQQLLCNLLKKKHTNGKRNVGRLRLISAICAVEDCSYEIQEILENLDSKLLARVLITGFIPENKMGMYMGIFNFFIVLPEIIASIFFGKIMSTYLNNDRLTAVLIGGCLLILAGLVCAMIIKEEKKELS